MTDAPPTACRPRLAAGFFYGLGAYGLWGVLPVYFKALAGVEPVDIVAHRDLVRAVPAPLLLLSPARGRRCAKAAPQPARASSLSLHRAADRRELAALRLRGDQRPHPRGSFGYYLNPLANVLLGRFVLKERLSRLQWAAVAVAAAGISVLAVGALGQLWISLTLCVSFATLWAARKVVAVDAVTGLAIETSILFPFAIGWLLWQALAGVPDFGAEASTPPCCFSPGWFRPPPLLLFTAAARRCAIRRLGMLQFLAPTLQFLIAVLIYGEPFTGRPRHRIRRDLDRARRCTLTALPRAPRLPTSRRRNDAHPNRHYAATSSRAFHVSLIIAFVFARRRLPSAARLGQLADHPARHHRRRRRRARQGNGGRNLNLFVIVIGVFRLMLGGGIL